MVSELPNDNQVEYKHFYYAGGYFGIHSSLAISLYAYTTRGPARRFAVIFLIASALLLYTLVIGWPFPRASSGVALVVCFYLLLGEPLRIAIFSRRGNQRQVRRGDVFKARFGANRFEVKYPNGATHGYAYTEFKSVRTLMGFIFVEPRSADSPIVLPEKLLTRETLEKFRSLVKD